MWYGYQAMPSKSVGLTGARAGKLLIVITRNLSGQNAGWEPSHVPKRCSVSGMIGRLMVHSRQPLHRDSKL